MTAVILDVDGTLVDTNYQHALAWYRAFRRNGVVLPIWRIHRHIGMGGDQLVGSLAGSGVETSLGEKIRAQEGDLYGEMIDEVEPFEEARHLLHDLHDRGETVILASSAKQPELERYLELLDGRSLTDGWTSAGDVDATKPQPDLVEAALDRAGTPADQTIMVGDSPWDAQAAARAGVRMVAVMTGGFSPEELRRAGATEVYESVADLRKALARIIPRGGRSPDPSRRITK